MKLSLFSYVVSLLFLLCLTSCSPDTQNARVSENASEIEKAYFEDYDSPRHKWGFIDTDGQVLVEPIYDELKDYVSGRCAANLGGRWGYLDEKGDMVIDAVYKQAYDFSKDGYSLVQDFDNIWFLIEKQGEVISEIPYSNISKIEYGYLVVSNGGLKTILNVKGEEIVKPSFSSVSLISDKYFIGKQNSLSAVFDYSGSKISEDYDKIYLPKSGYLRTRKDGLYYFLDNDTFQAVNEGGYNMALNFNGDNTVIKQASQFLILNQKLEIIKSLDFKDVRNAGEGFWKYKRDKNWGLLSPSGAIITPDSYEFLNRFSNNRIAYSNNSRWGYLNKSGESVIGGNLALAWDFHDGRARMIGNRGVGFIDTSGVMVIKDRFFEVREFYNGMSRFQTF